MNIDLTSEPMLGHWDVTNSVSQCEYQFGSRIIYVQYPKNERPITYIQAAQLQVQDAWRDIKNAVAFAEQLSRPLMPEFWKIHDSSGKPGPRLDAYSINFKFPDNRPTYTVSRSHDFDFSYERYEEADLWSQTAITELLPEPPDNLWLYVRRLGPNHFESTA
ncbi:hypothetical protein AAFF27_00575 [Xylophilus sp. GW821-FHT01B05]